MQTEVSQKIFFQLQYVRAILNPRASTTDTGTLENT